MISNKQHLTAEKEAQISWYADIFWIIVYYTPRETKMPPSQGVHMLFSSTNVQTTHVFELCKSGWRLLCFQTGEQVTGKKKDPFLPCYEFIFPFCSPAWKKSRSVRFTESKTCVFWTYVEEYYIILIYLT